MATRNHWILKLKWQTLTVNHSALRKDLTGRTSEESIYSPESYNLATARQNNIINHVAFTVFSLHYSRISWGFLLFPDVIAVVSATKLPNFSRSLRKKKNPWFSCGHSARRCWKSHSVWNNGVCSEGWQKAAREMKVVIHIDYSEARATAERPCRYDMLTPLKHFQRPNSTKPQNLVQFRENIGKRSQL